MGCEKVPIAGGFVFVCGRKKTKCSFCKVMVSGAVKLCDWKLTGEKAGQTCDAVMCRSCATQVAEGKDICPPHRRSWDKDPRNPKAPKVAT